MTRTMKDKERLLIIIKIFLHCHGTSTAKEIADYINSCPVKIQTFVTGVKIGTLLRGQRGIKMEKENGIRRYWVET